MKINYICQNTIKPTDKAFYLTPSIIYTYNGVLIKSRTISFAWFIFFSINIKQRRINMTREEIQEEYRKCVESFDYWKEHYFMRTRTTADWQEIVYAMRDEFNQNLFMALETYKQDRQKWVDWYNKKLMEDKI